MNNKTIKDKDYTPKYSRASLLEQRLAYKNTKEYLRMLFTKGRQAEFRKHSRIEGGN